MDYLWPMLLYLVSLDSLLVSLLLANRLMLFLFFAYRLFVMKFLYFVFCGRANLHAPHHHEIHGGKTCNFDFLHEKFMDDFYGGVRLRSVRPTNSHGGFLYEFFFSQRILMGDVGCTQCCRNFFLWNFHGLFDFQSGGSSGGG